MSAIAASAVITLGEFALQAVTAYNKAKADAAAAQVALDAAKIADLNRQIAGAAAVDDAVDTQINKDLGVTKAAAT